MHFSSKILLLFHVHWTVLKIWESKRKSKYMISITYFHAFYDQGFLFISSVVLQLSLVIIWFLNRLKGMFPGSYLTSTFVNLFVSNLFVNNLNVVWISNLPNKCIQVPVFQQIIWSSVHQQNDSEVCGISATAVCTEFCWDKRILETNLNTFKKRKHLFTCVKKLVFALFLW